MPSPQKPQIGWAQSFLHRHFTGNTLDYRQILAIWLPILVDQFFLISLNILNTAMISSSGVEAISAVNMVDSLNIFLINIFIAMATGGTVVIAQYKGSGNKNMLSRAVSGSITAAFGVALIIALTLIVFHDQVLYLLFGEADAAVFANAQIYLLGSCLSYCGIAVVEAVCGALRGIGESRSSLMLSVVMHSTYVLLNFILINGMGLGVTGMVISLNTARYLAAAVAILYLLHRKSEPRLKPREFFRFELPMLKRIFKIGFPFAAEQMFFNGGKILTQTFIVSMGTLAMATNAISASLTSLLMIPANALSLTIVTVVGQCMGHKDIDQARKIVRNFLGAGAVCYTIAGLLFWPFFTPILSLFHPPVEIIADIRLLLMLSSVLYIPLWGFSFLVPAALRAGGDAKFTSITSMLSMWLFRVSLGYFLGVTLGYGILGVWIAMFSEWGVRGIIFTLRFRGKKWYLHRVID